MAMIDIDNMKDFKTFNFTCEHCGQEFWEENFNISVFLYGVFLLLGKEKEYVGLTCPNCIKTILIKDNSDLVNYTKENLSYEAESFLFNLGGFPFYPQPRYHSSTNYDPKQISEIKGFDILYWYGELTEYVEDELDCYIGEHPQFKEKYLCPYIRGGKPPMGAYFSLWWFRKDQIDDLVDIENSKGLRIFPRYIQNISEIEKIDRFCWENHLYLNNLIQQEEEVKAQINELKEIAKQNNMDLQEILDANPGTTTPSIIERMKNQYDDWAEDRSFRVPTDFMAILATNLSSADFPFLSYSPLMSFLKTKHPFRGVEVPKSLNDFDLNQFERPQRGPNYKEMVRVVKTNFNKESTQSSLSILSNKFIFDYIELVQRVGFSYGAIWQLKEKYLKIVYDSIISPQERNTLLNEVSESELKEIQKAEEQFPNVKIISRDSKTNQIIVKMVQIAKLKKKRLSFLLLGERGTGKDLFAKAIHEASEREGNFIKVNCGTKSETLFESNLFGHVKGAFTGADRTVKGAFEEAENGTIFLDEIGNLTPNLQDILLNPIQDLKYQPVGSSKTKEIRSRFIYATNANLEEMVQNGKFRSDLYDRIDFFQIHIPPLRERKGDIPLLVKHFIEKHDTVLDNIGTTGAIQVTDECMNLFKKYDWPSNVRGLEHTIARIIFDRLADEDRSNITPFDLPPKLSEAKKGSRMYSMDEEKLPGNMKVTDEQIIYWMKKLNNNKSQVATQLSVSYRTILRRCKKLTL